MKTKLILFGITGDLSTRKLLPALEHIIDSGEVGDLQVIGVSRREVDLKELLGNRKDLAAHFSIVTMDLAKAADYVRLKQAVDLHDEEQAVIYLSVPPNAAADIVDLSGGAGLNGKNVKILFEKPFGYDLASAHDFLDRTARHYKESQIYRIDHYAAKDIAQELIRLRTNAENHHHSWSNESVASIDVVAFEKIGIEGRGTFYEQTGALRDFIQGHLMQLLALVLMDAPTDLGENKLAEYRLNALENLRVADPSKAVRAQYDSYQNEVGNPGSQVETFVSLQLQSQDSRWQGVPLTLATGKAMDAKKSAIIVNYKDGKRDTFQDGVLPIDGRKLDAYERVLIEAIKGNKAIFTTSPEVIRAWELVRPVQEAWEFNNAPLGRYKPGASLVNILQ